jgi:ComF family protein
VLCGGLGRAPDRDLCEGCEHDLPRNEDCCCVCAEPLPIERDDVTCGACLRRMPRFDACFAPYRYAYPLDHMIRVLKFAGGVAHARVLADLFAARHAEAEDAALPQLLLPVPLGRTRFIQRGYNQSIELATHISRRLAIPLRTDLLVRTRETREQAGLDRNARRKNLRQAFALRQPLPATHVAIVDDVVTTASTANEIARVLKRSGAARVDVWAIARAGRR